MGTENDNLHAGHRARQKEKFARQGLDAFTDVEALELLLYYAIPRRNTNEVAHRLLQRFRDLPGVLDASAEELAQVDGIGENAAALICLIRELDRRYLTARRRVGETLTSSEEVGEYLLPLFRYRREEVAVLLCLDSASRVISARVLGEGSGTRVNLSARDVVDTALREKAVRAVLAHNHLSGTALPSRADVESTERLRSAMELIGVELIDHLIFSDGDYVSMRESGFFSCR